MSIKNTLGQYFTTNIELKEVLFSFILNAPSEILEPSIGRGDLVEFVSMELPEVVFDMYEIDETIEMLDGVERDRVIYGDFLDQPIEKQYKTIIGNPPYIRTKRGNTYIDFIERCYDLLADDGELIFIVPSDFFKLTSASKLLDVMLADGSFTHVYHPHNEKLFEGASIDVIIFRYCRKVAERTTLYNGELLHLTNSNGLITFGEENKTSVLFEDYFDVCVGMVSGKEKVYKNDLGNIDVINGEGKVEKYIFIDEYPCGDEEIDAYLLQHKDELLDRKIRKFHEGNWFEWGAPRNITTIDKYVGDDCIYLYNLTRRTNVAFLGKVDYFGGGLIMLRPKKECNLHDIVLYLNSDMFKSNFMFSGRFKIGHRQICNSHLPL